MPKHPSRTEKRAAAAVTLAIALPVAIALWRTHLDAPPVLNAPAIVLPSPNAYDAFAGAARMLEHNLATTPGAKVVDPATDPFDSGALSARQLAARYPTAAKVAWVKKNAPVLALLRQGFSYAYVEPMLPSERLHVLVQLHDLARLLRVESHVRSASGDWAGAARSSLDALRLGVTVQNSGAYLACLMGCACNSAGRQDMQAILPHLGAADARADAASIERLDTARRSYAATLASEKWDTARDLCTELNRPNWRAAFTGDAMFGTVSRWFRLRLSVESKQNLLDSLLRLKDARIARAALTYHRRQHLPALKADDKVLAVTGLDMDLNFDWQFALDQSDNRLLMTQLALRAYKLDYGRWPASLQQLTPTYLKKIPLDPFDDGAPLHYQLLPGGPLLYSIGPDSIDNGGRPVESPDYGTSTRDHHLTAENSKGDVVAGIND